MGQANVNANTNITPETRRAFMRALLRDIEALEVMIERGMIESGINRIGAEQEMVIIDRGGCPFPIAQDIIDELADPHVTNELGKFNLEFNLDPLTFGGDCLGKLEDQINALLAKVRAAAYQHDARVVLAGILPALEKSDLGLDNLTDKPRYHALNEALTRMRGGPTTLHIEGIDELAVTHQSVMLEACNTSFQVHFQVAPEQFARLYNFAQAIAGPTLAVAVNSPMLFGRRLWHETRIALFQQSVDTRNVNESLRQFQPRVAFGTHWIRDSVLEIYREDVARFKPLFPEAFASDAIEVVERGDIPRLPALCLHNGTVYRWNRACYGVGNGKPHLRIENRVLPSGPTPADQVANAAFWFGLLHGLNNEYDDVRELMSFEDALDSFTSAARNGIDAQIAWFNGQRMPARELVALKLIPLAERGLRSAGVDEPNITRYLDIIERRAATGQTGASWTLRSFATMADTGSRGERLCRLTCAIADRQMLGVPVHEWSPVSETEFARDKRHIRTVGQYMTTDLFTVNETDVVDLVTNLMHWKHVRHVPVEDDEHRLVGLVSARGLLRHFGRVREGDHPRSVPVSEVMESEPITVSPNASTLDAVRLMRQHKISCLLVVEEEKLVGIVTEYDLMLIATPLLERFLSD
jgi:CBS domain-containing protein/gamma-glutamylcysteine synthetase